MPGQESKTLSRRHARISSSYKGRQRRGSTRLISAARIVLQVTTSLPPDPHLPNQSRPAGIELDRNDEDGEDR